MNAKAEKVYGKAYFELCAEENPEGLAERLDELDSLSKVFEENWEYVKLMSTPTVPMREKLELTGEVISAGGISEICGNLLYVLTEHGRFGCFEGIVKNFRRMYNEYYNIAEITVTTGAPMSESLKERVRQKMSEITGKTVKIREKVKPDIIGGIIIDYGSTRYDGSVKARLNALKSELGSVIS